MRIFEQLESEVRSYIRSFPVVFDTADLTKGIYKYAPATFAFEVKNGTLRSFMAAR